MNKITILKKADRLIGRCLSAVLSRPVGQHVAAPARVLIIRPGGIGDAICLLPTIACLKDLVPGVEVDVLVERRNAAAFELTDLDCRVLRYDKPAEMLGLLFRRRYDLVIDAEQWYHLSAVVARFVTSRMKVGFATNSRRRMFSHEVEYPEAIHEVEAFQKLLAPLGGVGDCAVQAPWLRLPDESRVEVSRIFPNAGRSRYVAVFPGGSVPQKRWGISKYQELVDHLDRAGWSCAVLGGPEDGEAGERICTSSGSALNLAGKLSLVQSAAMVEGASCFIGGDSGLMHIAAGLDVPVVALFGPGNWGKWGPYGEKHRVLSAGLSCAPCTRFGTIPACPHDVQCMQDISVDAVLNAVLEIVGTPERF